jgi:hypothetical protein
MIPNRRESAMATFFRKPDRRQRFLLPVDMQDWLPESDFLHLVLDAVEQMDLSPTEYLSSSWPSFFLYGAGLALWERDWPELAIRGTIALMLATFTLLGYANELRLIHESTVRIVFWCGLLTFSIVLAGLRFWKWAENLRGGTIALWPEQPVWPSTAGGQRSGTTGP